MVSRHIEYRALFIAGWTLLAVYIVVLLRLALPLNVGTLEMIEQERLAGGQNYYYEVTDGSGKVHMLGVPNDLTYRVLPVAQQRFGKIAAVKRVGDEEAKAWAAERSPVRLWLGVLLLMPLAMIGAGRRMRRREEQLQRFWQAISGTLSMDAAQLGGATGLRETEIRAAIATANRRVLTRFQWDRQSNRIFDARLSNHTITVSFCFRCNKPLNKTLPADLINVPSCSYCQYRLDMKQLEQLKADIVERLYAESRAARRSAGDGASFSLPLFVGLSIVFPPAAVAYADKPR